MSSSFNKAILYESFQKKSIAGFRISFAIFRFSLVHANQH